MLSWGLCRGFAATRSTTTRSTATREPAGSLVRGRCFGCRHRLPECQQLLKLRLDQLQNARKRHLNVHQRALSIAARCPSASEPAPGFLALH